MRAARGGGAQRTGKEEEEEEGEEEELQEEGVTRERCGQIDVCLILSRDPYNI